MMKTKKSLLIILVLVLLAGAWMLLGNHQEQPAPLGVELVKNGGFDNLQNNGLFESWETEAYLRVSDITDFKVSNEDENRIAVITNHDANDARFLQVIKVHPDTLYHLSGKIKAKADGGLGANLSIADVYVFSNSVYDTQDEWVSVSLYGRTGKNQREVTIYARLGGYSGEAVGTASFDQVSLVAVDSVPDDFVITLWEKPQKQELGKTADRRSPGPAAPYLLALSVVCSAVLLWIAQKAQREELLVKQKSGNIFWQLMLLLLISFTTRLIVAALVPGFPVDIGCFTSWANLIARVGPKGFYTSGVFSDYPPGYMLALWPIGKLGQLLGSGATELMVKSPAIICDVLIILLLFKVAEKKTNQSTAAWLSALYAVNPLTYLAGAAWGQADSVPSLLLMVAVLLVIDHNWKIALPVYVLSVLMKPQSLMVGPLGLLALILDCFWRKDKLFWKELIIGILASFTVIFVIAFPFFNKKNGWPWLIELYQGTMGYYDYASVNATNLYFLFGKNWVGTSSPAPFLLRLAGILTMLLPVSLFSFQKVKASAQRKSVELFRQNWLFFITIIPVLFGLLPMSMKVFGILSMISVFMLVAVSLIQEKNHHHLPLLSGVLLIGFSVLGTMMHERYLFLAVALLTLAYVINRDRRLLFLLALVSLLCFLNTGIVLDRGVRIGGGEGNLTAPASGLISDSAWLEYILSAVSLLAAGIAFYIGLAFTSQGFVLQRLTSVQSSRTDHKTNRIKDFLAPKKMVHFDRKDSILIIIVTALYAALAFINLGSAVAPQTYWISGFRGTEITLDLGKTETFELQMYWGINWKDSELTISVSEDGENYSMSYPGRVTYGDCFAWRTLTIPYYKADGSMEFGTNPQQLTGRYVKIAGNVGNLMLMEVIAQDAATGANIPFVSVSQGAEAVIDEQQLLSGKPTWYNSMYFDEIYHARTAFEQRNALWGLEPNAVYETTHPPLGKVFMTFSIMLFGMTPFGWRFAGALAGVLMLPGMYLIGKQMTRKRRFGIIAMLLMTFDFMHFTQTRIATIDSFVTLFIIYSYFFMFRYMGLDHFRTPLNKSLKPLLFSGIMMGLGIASKWTGVYAAFGLAILFFWTLIKNMSAFRLLALSETAVLPLDSADKEILDKKKNTWMTDGLITCLWCVLFFIVIPLAIYYLSYIPVFMQTSGGLTPAKVIGNNISMFEYHSVSGRGADHAWASPWWSWPTITKPMYFYSGGARDGTSSVIWSFGNPAVWWTGLLSLVLIAVWGIFQRRIGSFLHRKPLEEKQIDDRPYILLIGFLAQYLPWVLVPRGTYIYHYFPSVPFIILCIAVLLDKLSEFFPRTIKIIGIVLPAIAFALFVAFFPYISGVRVSTQWLSMMQWFPRWLYF